MDIEVLKKPFNYAAHLQHIYGTFTAHVPYRTCSVMYSKCTIAAHILLCCKCGVAALVQECAVAEYVLVNGQMEENISFFRHEIGVRFGVGIKKKIMLFSLSFYLFPLFFGGDEVQM